MKKYSVSLHGHATSVSLEPELWKILQKIAEDNQMSVAGLIALIDDQRVNKPDLGLSAAIRAFILEMLNRHIDFNAFCFTFDASAPHLHSS